MIPNLGSSIHASDSLANLISHHRQLMAGVELTTTRPCYFRIQDTKLMTYAKTIGTGFLRITMSTARSFGNPGI